ncbi:hypothetical protein [Duganella sp. BuS-21]|uniref:hypothetical protein n=1 Tax=Duganella sp. BuS-21 TaxID=2943848 RepID=UPI0035A661C6
MTRIAPPDLLQCPACAGYFKRYEFTSLHFDDDVPVSSDDKNGNWWAGESGAVGRCPSCASVVWIDDAVVLMPAPQEARHIGPLSRVWQRITGDRSGRLQAERKWKSLPAGIQQAERFDGLKHAHDYIEALKILPPGVYDREIHLPRDIWWASNEYLRGKRGGMFVALPGVAEHEAHANMQRLQGLLKQDS